MAHVNIESELNKKNLMLIADNMQAEMYKFKFSRASDFLLTRHLEFYEKEIEKIKILASQDPRYKWQLFQHGFDAHFKNDPSLTGGYAIVDWKPSDNPRRVKLNLNLY